MESALMRLQSLRVDTHRQLSEHFKLRVQLQEQMDDNDAKLHFCRGVVAALDEMEKIINESLTEPGIPSEGFEFEGQAMAKQERDKIEYPGEYEPAATEEHCGEYVEGKFQPTPVVKYE